MDLPTPDERERKFSERPSLIGRASRRMLESHPLSGTEWRKIFSQYEGEASSIGILAVCQTEGPASKKGESGLPFALTRWSGFSSPPQARSCAQHWPLEVSFYTLSEHRSQVFYLEGLPRRAAKGPHPANICGTSCRQNLQRRPRSQSRFPGVPPPFPATGLLPRAVGTTTEAPARRPRAATCAPPADVRPQALFRVKTLAFCLPIRGDRVITFPKFVRAK